MSVCVAIFAKPPVPGVSKTRLGRAIGDEGAAAVARTLLRDVWAVLDACPWAEPVLATTDVSDRTFGLGAVTRWDQGTGDLGARVERVLRRGVALHGAAMAVGADTVGLDAALLDEARRRLGEGPVLGPSDDGGFYLLALRAVPGGLLATLPWSRPDTCAATAARLEARVGAVQWLPERFDVDEVAELERMLTLTRAGALAPSETSALAERLLLR
jgi:glycosyltransferase A (GT-A) superfamily protein (DUF2064 family)